MQEQCEEEVEGGEGKAVGRHGSGVHERRRSSGGGSQENQSLMMRLLRPTCVPVTIVVTLSLLIVVMALLDGTLIETQAGQPCCDCDACR